MNEFFPRNDPVTPAGSVTDRLSTVVRAVASVPPAPRSEVGQRFTPRPALAPKIVPDAPDGIMLAREDTARAFATYSKIQTQIADVVAALAQPPRQGPTAVAQADDSLLSMIPAPSVVLPLPPADEEMVAFVGQVAQSIARQAAQFRAAHASVSPAAVDAATA